MIDELPVERRQEKLLGQNAGLERPRGAAQAVDALDDCDMIGAEPQHRQQAAGGHLCLPLAAASVLHLDDRSVRQLAIELRGRRLGRLR